MRTCSVCGEVNEDLAVVCRSCHSYLQAKVDTIDLFSTIWGLIESPKATFRKIVLSRQKNYVVLLYLMAGLMLALGGLQEIHAAERIDNLGAILGLAILAGPVAGLLLALIGSGAAMAVGRLLGGRGTFRNARAVLAFAMVPLAMILVVIFPVQFGVFGRYLFDPNPAPSVINPPVHFALLAFYAGAVLWAMILHSIGSSVAQSFAWWKGALSTAAVVALAVVGAALLHFV
jgi:hypothetical protein